MSTTLQSHPPQRAARPRPVEQEAPRLTSRRPTPLERLALRLGLLLIMFGRRRYALPREHLAGAYERDRARRARELEWDRARGLLLPPR